MSNGVRPFFTLKAAVSFEGCLYSRLIVLYQYVVSLVNTKIFALHTNE